MDRESTERATRAVREAGARIADPARPGFHFRPPAGWMNDPNGPIHHGGRYHLFYQHNPYDDCWGDIHWGHARSPDLVRWENLPVALAPSRELGEAHCFTGSAWENDVAGTLLFYTSVAEDPSLRPQEQWAVRCGPDLESFRKLEENPVLVPDAPGDSTGATFRSDWRDPFVFEAGERTLLILGAVLEEGTEEVLGGDGEVARPGDRVIPLYEAVDPSLTSWRYRGILRRFGREGVTFPECPNLFAVGDRWVLTYSAHRPSRALVGGFDTESGCFRQESTQPLDRCSFFYAPARFARAPGESAVLVGWVRGWNGGRGWNGVLSLPRLLELAPDGTLRQRPLAALGELRRPGSGLEPAAPGSAAARVPGVRSPTLEVEAELGGAPGEAPTAASGVRLVSGDRTVASVSWRPGEEVVEIGGIRFPEPGGEEGPPGAPEVSGRWETTPVPLPAAPGDEPGEGVDLHLFWDRSVLEVFLDDGREACTLVLDTDGEPLEVEAFAAAGAPRPPVRAWPLEEIW